MTNPLLTAVDLPSYAAIQPEHVEPAIHDLLAENRAAIEQLLAADTEPTWDNLITRWRGTGRPAEPRLVAGQSSPFSAGFRRLARGL